MGTTTRGAGSIKTTSPESGAAGVDADPDEDASLPLVAEKRATFENGTAYRTKGNTRGVPEITHDLFLVGIGCTIYSIYFYSSKF